MAYTAEGRRQRQMLLSFNADILLDALRPIIEQVPNTVVQRVKSTGSGREKRFTAYSQSWANTRGKKGLQTGNKDFWFDGTMWSSYKIVKEEVGDGYVSFTLTTTDGKSRSGSLYLTDIHSDNEGENILDITEEEEDKLMDAVFKKIEDVFSSAR